MAVILVKNFIDKKRANEMADRLDHEFFLHDFKATDTIENSYDSYGIFNKELDEWALKLEQITNKKLFSTFSYGRAYLKDAQLFPHTDRGACEYVMTLCLSNKKDPWPLYVEADDIIHKILLEEGDALVYKGIEYKHWRNKLLGESVYQAMFCYVDQNGKYASRKDDSGMKLRS